MYLWAKIRSWHLTLAVLTTVDGRLLIPTLCGRYASAAFAREVESPSGEATCETCFRIRESRGRGDSA